MTDTKPNFMPIYLVGFLARFSYALARSPVLPLFALYLGAGPEAIGFVVGVSTVTGIFFKMPSGALSDVIGRRRTLFAGLIVFAVMPFTYLFVKDYNLLVIIRFIHGLATAIYGPVAMAVVADEAGAKKGEVLSWFSSVTIIGNLLGAPVGGFILHTLAHGNPTFVDFQRAYLLSGITGIMALIFGIKMLKDDKPTGQKAGLKAAYKKFASGIKEVISDKRVVITSAMEGIQNMSMGALEAFLPIYAVKVALLNELQAGLLWGVQVLVTILSKPVMGKTSDKYGRTPIIAAGLLLCAVSFAMFPLFKSFYLLICCALVFGFGEALVTSSSAALVADICKEKHFGAAMGTFGTIFDIGHASGPILAGVLIAKFDYLHTFWMMASLIIVAIPVFLLNVKNDKG
ncbi:MFS transporter [Candidatus Magnetomonas plexicatena]|uniref:MFS transporter n=1 Tax=Candidatus Magnetomonas plexicatena TaxID=2552947 RepID=UPI004033072E